MIQLSKYSNSNDTSDGLDLTALIDVIFTLIIFLVLTMGTTQIMTDINITHTKKSQVSSNLKNHPIVVEVSQSGQYWKLDDQLIKEFPQFKNQFLTSYGDQQQRPVVLALEKTLPVEKLVALMDFLSMNGFSNIQIVSQWTP